MRLVYHSSQGFTLLELMIAVAIVGILAMMAIPSYSHYIRKAYYSEIVDATAPFKIGVTECYQMTNDLNSCNGGNNGIPDNITSETGGIASVVVTAGQVLALPVEKNGFTKEDDYILTPALKNNTLLWTATGGAVMKGYAKGAY